MGAPSGSPCSCKMYSQRPHLYSGEGDKHAVHAQSHVQKFFIVWGVAEAVDMRALLVQGTGFSWLVGGAVVQRLGL